MTIRHMKIFAAVCRNGNNLSRAARELCTTQPAVSLAVHELEEHYGVLFFDRIGRRLFLTEAGKRFLQYTVRVLELLEEMEAGMLSWNQNGTIRIGGSITTGYRLMPDLVEDFRRDHPELHIEVVIQPSRILGQKIASNELDLAIVETPSIEGAEEMLVREELFQNTLVPVAPPAGQYAGREAYTAAEFAALPFLLREKGSGTRHIFDSVMFSAGYEIHPVWESESSMALINAVRRGVGVTVLPVSIAEAPLQRGEIVRIYPEGLVFLQKFYLIYHRDKRITGILRDFADVLREKTQVL